MNCKRAAVPGPLPGLTPQTRAVSAHNEWGYVADETSTLLRPLCVLELSQKRVRNEFRVKSVQRTRNATKAAGHQRVEFCSVSCAQD